MNAVLLVAGHLGEVEFHVLIPSGVFVNTGTFIADESSERSREKPRVAGKGVQENWRGNK